MRTFEVNIPSDVNSPITHMPVLVEAQTPAGAAERAIVKGVELDLIQINGKQRYEIPVEVKADDWNLRFHVITENLQVEDAILMEMNEPPRTEIKVRFGDLGFGG